MALLRDVFGKRIISKNLWPPWSLSLALPDNYSSGTMKYAIFKANLHALLEMK
jgi:hypothetical protein